MDSRRRAYHGYRFPPEIISHAVWLYHRFSLSFRDVEDLLAERGITASYEAIRQWCLKFGPRYARRLKRRQGRLGDTWHLDEVFVTIDVVISVGSIKHWPDHAGASHGASSAGSVRAANKPPRCLERRGGGEMGLPFMVLYREQYWG